MFESLSERLTSTFNRLKGIGKITEANIQEASRDIRMALLEADVALPVVKAIIEQVKEKAMGEEVLNSLSPGQVLTKAVNDVLTSIMGEENNSLDLQATPPVVILMAGLQGSGKTTTVAKLANKLKAEKKVMVVSTDVYRPAAIEQLQRLADDIGVMCHPSHSGDDPIKIAKAALQSAKQQVKDVLIIDTAGRLHIDSEMMSEIKQLHKTINPTETLFVVDSMTGQDAANTAKAFDDALPLTGIILTKTDGDARGGAALSVRHITGKPIKFLGVGEKIDALEAFHPDRMASRILGMGDIVSLVEEVQTKVDQKKAEKVAKKLKKGGGFDLQDFLEQLQQMQNMGGMAKLMDKMPGMGKMAGAMKNQVSDKTFKRFEAIIQSMTMQEKRFPGIIKGSRKQRIAKGSGVEIPEVNRLIKQFTQMQKMMKKFAKGGMSKMMKKMQGMMPPGGGDLPF